ncbi:MAG: glycosyltransferase family 2 protein [Clostridiales bacterium]|nr:glycosyltransferase family 2 protein [Clostridiales bacterium]
MLKETPFFSIVMPVYNVEKYLTDAVNSVIGQTFGDFELLLMDDCSPDKSPEMCDAFAESDERIRAIHLEKNNGVSNTRNIGAQEASGKYLMFMDSDDYIDTSLLADVYASLEKNEAEVVVFGMSEELFSAQGEHISTKCTCVDEQLFSDRTQLRKYIVYLEQSTLYGYACNKFYSVEYLRKIKIKYSEYALLEDIYFNIAFFQDITKLNVLGNSSYHYRKVSDQNSRTAKFVNEYFELHRKKIEMLVNQQQSWGVLSDDSKTIIADIFARYIFSAIERNCDSRSGMNAKLRRQWLINLYDDEIVKLLLPFMSQGAGLQGKLNRFLVGHNIRVCLFFGEIISFIKRRFPVVFYKLKQ